MNNAETKPGSSKIRSLIGSIADWIRALVDWIRARAHKDGSPSRGMLLDEDPYPASYSLSYVHERPVFNVDKDRHREFALLDDLADRGELKASDRPRTISESESGQARPDR